MKLINLHNKSVLILACFITLLLGACDFGANKSPETHIAQAKQFIAENKLNESLIELKNALQLESNLPEARWLLGKVYLQQGNGAAAFKELSQAQTLGFSDPELSKSLLQAMLLQGRNQDILDQTFTEDSMSADTLLLRGNAHMGLREFDKARDSFNDALELDSASVGARKGLISIAIFEQNFDEAEKLIDEALGFALEDAEIWILKGQLAFSGTFPKRRKRPLPKPLFIRNPVPRPSSV